MKDYDAGSENFMEALLQVDRIRASEVFKENYSDCESFKLLEELVIGSLEKLGEDWEEGLVSLAQIYMGGLICEELIEEYLPMAQVSRKMLPKMGIGVLQDHHALGKRIVCSMLRAGGYELMDFGYGLNCDEIVDMAVENGIEILLISTLMLPSAMKVKEVRKKLDDRGSKMKIIVGGAPFRLDADLWKEVGADATADSATDIIGLIEKVVKG